MNIRNTNIKPEDNLNRWADRPVLHTRLAHKVVKNTSMSVDTALQYVNSNAWWLWAHLKDELTKIQSKIWDSQEWRDINRILRMSTYMVYRPLYLLEKHEYIWQNVSSFDASAIVEWSKKYEKLKAIIEFISDDSVDITPLVKRRRTENNNTKADNFEKRLNKLYDEVTSERVRSLMDEMMTDDKWVKHISALPIDIEGDSNHQNTQALKWVINHSELPNMRDIHKKLWIPVWN